MSFIFWVCSVGLVGVDWFVWCALIGGGRLLLGLPFWVWGLGFVWWVIARWVGLCFCVLGCVRVCNCEVSLGWCVTLRRCFLFVLRYVGYRFVMSG